MRQVRYFVFKNRSYDALLFVPDVTITTISHVIAVASGYVIDGAHTHVMPLTPENMHWCCGAGTKYVGIKKGYEVTIPKKVHNYIANK